MSVNIRRPEGRYIQLETLQACCGFTGFYQVSVVCCFIKLLQVCENQTSCNMTSVDLQQVGESTCIKSVDNATCSRLAIIKPEQGMRTHPDIGLMFAR